MMVDQALEPETTMYGLISKLTHVPLHVIHQERAALLEMVVVREKEVFFLETDDVKAALLASEEADASANAAVKGEREQ